jgi:hypothetical protein
MFERIRVVLLSFLPHNMTRCCYVTRAANHCESGAHVLTLYHATVDTAAIYRLCLLLNHLATSCVLPTLDARPSSAKYCVYKFEH